MTKQLYTFHPYGDNILVKFSNAFIELGLLPNILSDFNLVSRVGVDSLMVENYGINNIDKLEEILDLSLSNIGTLDSKSSKSKEIIINVDYSFGLDFETVSAVSGLSRSQIISLHSETVWRVALIGFAPGFPYLAPMSNKDVWDTLPRLSTPRTSVPKGSIAVAAGMSCIYPQQMPGGWNIIGMSTLELFNPNEDYPSLLSAGDTVRFEALDA